MSLLAGALAWPDARIRPRAACEHVFVRWDNLTIDAEERAPLPGYREPAVVRHFDAPEALDTRFYEVRAKSRAQPRARALARCRSAGRSTRTAAAATPASTAPRGDTPILLADGRTRPLADLRVGDRDRRHRAARARTAATSRPRSSPTGRPIKPAYRVTLEDGTSSSPAATTAS